MLCILHVSYIYLYMILVSLCCPCPHALPREQYTGPKYGLTSDRLLKVGEKRVKEEHNFQTNSKKDGEIEV